LVKQAKEHDASKFKEPELTPYKHITWSYKMKDEGESFEVSDELRARMTAATIHHVKNNKHHPEYHSPVEVDLINREDRDKPPEKIVDAMAMPDEDIAEMCADWLAMAEEKGTSAKSWADKNVNIRWKFTDKQKALIYHLLEVGQMAPEGS
jgi:hypothetical protein